MSRKLRISTVRMICLGGFYLFVLLVYAMSAQAQPRQLPDFFADPQQVEAMAERLQLSTAQREAIRPILLDFADSTRAIMDKYAIDPASGTRPPLSVLFGVRNDMKKNQQQLDDQLATILTPDQMRTFRQMQDERRKQFREELSRTN